MADAERRLPATERKLRKAREEGQVPRSRDLGHFAAVAACFALLVTVARPLGAWLLDVLAEGLHFNASTLQQPMMERLAPVAGKLLMVLGPLGLALTLVAVAAAALSGGWNFTW